MFGDVGKSDRRDKQIKHKRRNPEVGFLGVKTSQYFV